MHEDRNQRWIRLITVAFFAHIGLAMWFVERGMLNADEGWYLYAARQIALGFEPYRDFALVQVPVFPLVMSGTVEAGAGAILAARWVSWVFLCAGTGATILAASRLYGQRGAAIVAIGMGLHPLVLNHGVLARPYGLTVLLLGGGLLVVTGGQRSSMRTVIGFALMGIGAGTRLTILVPALILALAHPLKALAGAGLLVGFALAMHPVLTVDPSTLYEQLLGFHLADGGTVAARLGWIANVTLVWCIAVMAWLPGPRSHRLPGIGLASLGAVLVHGLPAALHIEHLVAATPVIALAAADRWAAALNGRRSAIGLIALGGAAALFSRPFIQVDEGVSTVRQTMQLGRWVDENSRTDAPMITVQLALAVEADRSVARGLEMGRFGWVPELDSNAATRSHRMSVERLRDVGQRASAAIAIAEGDFDASSRRWLRAIGAERASASKRIEEYGQFSEPLSIFAMDGATLWMR